MSKSKEYSWVTKDKLMTYTFSSLAVLTAISVLSFGYIPIIIALIAVGVAVGIDVLLSKVAADSQLNIMSVAVFGLIVTDSYTLGLPNLGVAGISYSLNVTMQGAGLYIFPALISMVGMVLFKKLQGITGRKYVNPAVAAKKTIRRFILGVSFKKIDGEKRNKGNREKTSKSLIPFPIGSVT